MASFHFLRMLKRSVGLICCFKALAKTYVPRRNLRAFFFVELAEAFFKSRVAAGAAVVADGLVEGAGGRKNPHVAFRAGDGGVD